METVWVGKMPVVSYVRVCGKGKKQSKSLGKLEVFIPTKKEQKNTVGLTLATRKVNE